MRRRRRTAYVIGVVPVCGRLVLVALEPVSDVPDSGVRVYGVSNKSLTSAFPFPFPLPVPPAVVSVSAQVPALLALS